MLRIRPEQVHALRAASREELARRLLAHVREAFRERAPESNDELLAQLRQAIGRATELGLDTDRELATYVDVQYAIGGVPEERPWAADILGDASLPGALKARLLFNRAVERLDRGDV